LGSAPTGAAAAIAKEALNFDESKFKAFGINLPLTGENAKKWRMNAEPTRRGEFGKLNFHKL